MTQNLIDIIKNNTDVTRWDAIERLLDNGHKLKDINKRAGFGDNYLNKWRYRNKDKYSTKKSVSTPSQSHRNTGGNDDKSTMSIDIEELIKKEQYHMEEAGIDTSNHPKVGHWSKRIELPKYGEIIPQLKVSTLSHHDWGRKIWGEFKFRWELGYITELEQGLWNLDRTAWELPRFHGKTETVIKLGVRETVEKWHPYLMITNKFLKDRLFKMWSSYYTNRNFRLMYGDIIEVKSGYTQLLTSSNTGWVNQEYIDWPYKDPLFQIISKDQEAIGGHPGHLHFEDILQKMPKSETSFDDLKQMVQDDWLPMLSKEIEIEGRATGTWTRKELGDLYEWFKTELSWNIINHKGVRGVMPGPDQYEWDAQKKNIQYISPDAIARMDLLNPHQDPKKLLKMAIKQPAAFASQIQNDPIARGDTYFDVKQWQPIEPFKLTNFNRYGGCDPALGLKSSDFTAIVYLIWHQDHIVITDVYLEKNIGFNEVLNKNREYYNRNRPTQYFLHGDRSDQAVVQSLRGKIHFAEHKNTENKIAKIDGFKEYSAVKPIYYFNDINPLYISEMKKQVQTYDRRPSTATKHDDFLDILVTIYNRTKNSYNNTRLNFISR